MREKELREWGKLSPKARNCWIVREVLLSVGRGGVIVLLAARIGDIAARVVERAFG